MIEATGRPPVLVPSERARYSREHVGAPAGESLTAAAGNVSRAGGARNVIAAGAVGRVINAATQGRGGDDSVGGRRHRWATGSTIPRQSNEIGGSQRGR
jgi:hypothetical protein